MRIVGGLEDMNPMPVYTKKFICPLHFTNDCTSPGTKKLNANAYPSINLPNREMVNDDILKENVQHTGMFANNYIQLFKSIEYIIYSYRKWATWPAKCQWFVYVWCMFLDHSLNDVDFIAGNFRVFAYV